MLITVSGLVGVQMLAGMSVKEFFVFADPEGNLYHLTVEGSVVKDGARLSPPVGPLIPFANLNICMKLNSVLLNWCRIR